MKELYYSFYKFLLFFIAKNVDQDESILRHFMGYAAVGHKLDGNLKN